MQLRQSMPLRLYNYITKVSFRQENVSSRLISRAWFTLSSIGPSRCCLLYTSHTFTYIRTIICSNIQITYFFHLVLKNKEILCLGTNDRISGNAMLVKPFHLRIYRSCPNTTCYENDFFLLKLFEIFMEMCISDRRQ